MGLDPELLRKMDSIVVQYKQLHDEIGRIWTEQMVFTWHWWLDVALALLPWIIWFIVRDKKNTHNLLYAGMFALITAMLLDIMGSTQGLWNYNTLLLPDIPQYLPWDLSIMPVMAMLFYQFFPKVKAWVKGLVFGGIAAYAVEPIFVWLGFYEPSGWEHHYSLPIYFAIYMIGYWLYTRKKVEALHG